MNLFCATESTFNKLNSDLLYQNTYAKAFYCFIGIANEIHPYLIFEIFLFVPSLVHSDSLHTTQHCFLQLKCSIMLLFFDLLHSYFIHGKYPRLIFQMFFPLQPFHHSPVLTTCSRQHQCSHIEKKFQNELLFFLLFLAIYLTYSDNVTCDMHRG